MYFISQILFILGLPKLKSVSGFARTGVRVDDRLLRGGSFGVEDISDGLVKFENGIGLEVLASDFGGGKRARPGGMGRSWNGEPNLKFFGKFNGRDVAMDLRCDENGQEEELTNPRMLYYNDNQAMWLAYKLGILDDSTRYNTPEIAAQQLLLTDGIFLSEELGRSVTVPLPVYPGAGHRHRDPEIRHRVLSCGPSVRGRGRAAPSCMNERGEQKHGYRTADL